MDYDDIKETVHHEIAHHYERSHEVEFHNKKIKIDEVTWRPPTGTTHIRERLSQEEIENSMDIHELALLKAKKNRKT